MKILSANKLLNLVKMVFLILLGPIIFWGSSKLEIRGGFWKCPFILPFVMCKVCPVHCSFGTFRSLIFLGIVGSGFLLGRFFCGLACPFGVMQDFLYKISPVKFLNSTLKNSTFKYFRYILLIIVLGLTLKYIFPMIDLPVIDSMFHFFESNLISIRNMFVILILMFLVFSLLKGRLWCQYICPVGAWLSVFNTYSIYKLRADKETCSLCYKCKTLCSSGLNPLEESDLNSKDCVRCLECVIGCSKGAIRIMPFYGKKTYDNKFCDDERKGVV